MSTTAAMPIFQNSYPTAQQSVPLANPGDMCLCCCRSHAPAPVRAFLLFLCLTLLPSRVRCVTWTGLGSGYGASHTCGLRAAAGGGQDLYCWGYNYYGQLGLGYATTTGCSCVPSASSSPVLSVVSAVALGYGHTCGLLTNGTVACWGVNDEGQVGVGGTTSVWNATTLPSLSGVTAIAAGYAHTCAVASRGNVYCWGRNREGQLGNGGTAGATSPVWVRGISSVIAIACGRYHTCAVTSSGDMHCWGYNAFGQLGNGDISDVYSPSATPVLTGVAGVAAGNAHTCARTSAGEVHCWGWVYFGQLGLGYLSQSAVGCNCVTSPPLAPVMTRVAHITAGEHHVCALSTAGGVYCWGINNYGQLGNGYHNAEVLSPPSTPVLTGALAISAGVGHTCALMTSGSIECWGNNENGQYGDGGTSSVYAPTPAPTPLASVSPTASTTATPGPSTPPSQADSVSPSSIVSPSSSVPPEGPSHIPSATATGSPSNPSAQSESLTRIGWAAVGAGIGAGLLLLFLFVHCCKAWHKRRQGSAAALPASPDTLKLPDPLRSPGVHANAVSL